MNSPENPSQKVSRNELWRRRPPCPSSLSSIDTPTNAVETDDLTEGGNEGEREGEVEGDQMEGEREDEDETDENDAVEEVDDR
ncbi:hypothetical protein FBU30_007738 [Linnemannia zychae]|nr:hypothetical protein FBU30_007738 [Linnemannia zychae]